jgi:cobalamin synthase
MNRVSLRRALVWYVVACVGVIGLAMVAMMNLYHGTSAEYQAMMVSAIVALVIQVIAFAIARRFAASGNGIAGWTLGAVICLTSLVIYGFVGRAVGLPSNAALLSLATFFFLTELIEPPLLNV